MSRCGSVYGRMHEALASSSRIARRAIKRLKGDGTMAKQTRKVFVLGGKSGSKGKTLKLLKGERVFVGLDVHKSTFTVALWSDKRDLVGGWSQPASYDTLISKLSVIAPQIARVVYEAGPTGYGLVRRLREAKLPADVIAPSKVPEAPGRNQKCDRLDAKKLAEYACKDLLKSVCVPTVEEEADRQVLRTREAVHKKLKRAKQQIKSFLLTHGLSEPDGLGTWAKRGVDALHEMELSCELRFSLDSLLRDLEHQCEELKRVNDKIEELAEQERHREDVRILRSMKGVVGVTTAMAFKTELYQASRFNTPDEVVAMVGFVPGVRQSGKTRREGGILKTGNSHLRAVLVEAAWRWIRHDESAKERFRRLCANTGDGKKAIVGVARHLLVVLWRMLTRKEEYRAAA
jgi:transposase